MAPCLRVLAQVVGDVVGCFCRRKDAPEENAKPAEVRRAFSFCGPPFRRIRRLLVGRSLCDTSTAKPSQVHTQNLPDWDHRGRRMGATSHAQTFRRLAGRSGGQARGMRVGQGLSQSPPSFSRLTRWRVTAFQAGRARSTRAVRSESSASWWNGPTVAP